MTFVGVKFLYIYQLWNRLTAVVVKFSYEITHLWKSMEWSICNALWPTYLSCCHECSLKLLIINQNLVSNNAHVYVLLLQWAHSSFINKNTAIKKQENILINTNYTWCTAMMISTNHVSAMQKQSLESLSIE